MEKQEGDVAEKWDRLRDEGEKSKKNKSGVPYNMISLRYVRSRVHTDAIQMMWRVSTTYSIARTVYARTLARQLLEMYLHILCG